MNISKKNCVLRKTYLYLLKLYKTLEIVILVYLIISKLSKESKYNQNEKYNENESIIFKRYVNVCH